ncbi:MAG: hypothetical protein DHS20C12_13620 [Pseudohongiella sp.]|nr:MAG: hypothetical protein DHS20C12_13620 [Pseudohongiella sp.]
MQFLTETQKDKSIVVLSNEEKARYGIVLDKERSELRLNEDYKTQRSLTIMAGVLGVSLVWINPPTGFIFFGAAVFFARRWRSMENRYQEAQGKIQRYEHFLDSRSD